jgi:TPR repeat protein
MGMKSEPMIRVEAGRSPTALVISFRKINARALKLATVVAFLLLQSVSGIASNHDKGLQAYMARDYPRAMKLWRSSAIKGHPEAQYGLGSLYDHGQGVRQDDAKAVGWYRKAAEKGHALAQYNLGNMLGDGRGAPRNMALALQWLQKSAEQGNDSAQFNLGMKYHYDAAFRDPAKAAGWYAKAADQNHLNATTNLGVLYMAGLGVAKDDARAIELYRRAARQGHALAQTYLGDMYHWGRGVERDDATSTLWHRKAAEQGDFQGLLKLAIAYRDGIGVPADQVLAYVFAAHDPKFRKFDLLERSKLAEDLKGRLTEEQLAEAQAVQNAWTIGRPSPTTSRTGRK